MPDNADEEILAKGNARYYRVDDGDDNAANDDGQVLKKITNLSFRKLNDNFFMLILMTEI